jgi:methyl-accepting chemotaxis protein
MARALTQVVAAADQADSTSRATVDSSEQGQRAVASLAASMEALGERMEQTVTIVKTIDAIAFQTNLLALNARIEAARAGDGGRSFAIVANEVRALAQRAAAASSETGILLAECARNVAQGRQATASVGELFGQIHSTIGELSRINARLAQGNREQAVGVAEMERAIGRIDHLTRQSAEGAERSAEAGRELHGQAGALNQQVAALAGIISRDGDAAAP